jgi:DNA-binding response OmpR family regulator
MVRMMMRTNVGPQPTPTSIKATNAPVRRVLIIDDESDICLLLSGLLRKLGYIPTCAQYIEEGRQCLSSQQYDAIFLDLNLPDGLGFDLLPIIREEQKNARVIMISAFDGQAERRRAQEQGADFFVGKPFTRLSVEKALQSTQV